MRFLAALLILANLTVYLLVNRLPETESVQAPDINLPRVTRIQMLDSDETSTRAPGHEDDCFALSGFLAPTGARNWLRLNGLASEQYRVVRDGSVERPVFAIRLAETDALSGLVGRLGSSLEPFSFLTNDSPALLLFADSGEMAAYPFYGAENKRGFTLESETASFYSYAIVGEEALREAWMQRFPANYSGALSPESCESIAKQGQNP